MTDEQLAAIRARLDAATPGPWKISGELPDYEHYTRICVESWIFDAIDIDVPVCPDGFTKGEIDERDNPQADAALIAHAPTDIAALLDAIAARDAEIERLRKIELSIIGQLRQ